MHTRGAQLGSRLAASGRLRGLTLVAAPPAAALASCVVLAFFDPRAPGPLPGCPFQAVTGLYCPGCGTVRALHRLVAFDPAGFVAYNPLLLLALPYLALAYLGWARRRLSDDPAPRRLAPAWAGVAVPVVVVAFWVARNLPGLEALAPA